MLGDVAARRLGIDRPGVLVWLDGRWFTVIGILDHVELADELDRAALVGYPYAIAHLGIDGAPGTLYIRADPSSIEDVRGVLAATANPAGGLAGLYPAARAARISPSEALRTT